MNYMTHCLAGLLGEAPGVMEPTVLKDSVQEINYTRHVVLCLRLDCIHLGLNSVSFLAPLITY